MSPGAFLLAAVVVLGGSACATVEGAAAKDPMRCERDPACSKAKSAYPDCSRQCADDPECMDRCRQVQQGSDSLGHPQ